MADLNGGRAVVELLKAEGVRYIFGIVGSTFLDVLDALYDDRAIEYINVRHEQAAAFMADGLARVTDLPGVCLVTSGPGATNLLTGVAAAHVAHSPVVVLVGGVALDHAQKDAFQEYDLVSMFKPVTKLALQITRPERIPDLLRAALRAAMTGRRGPVLVEIPRDVLSEPLAQAEPLAAAAYRVTHPLPPHPDAIRDAVRLLRQAERPLLIVGGGVNRAGAGDLVVRLSEQYGIPVDHRLRPQRRGAERAPALHRPAGPRRRAGSRDGMPSRRPHPGRRLAPGAVHHALRRSLHPSRRPDRPGRYREPRHRSLLSGRRRHPGRRARGVRRPCSTRSARDGGPAPKAAWRQEAEALRAQRQARLAGEAKLDAQPLKPQRVYAELRRVLPPDTIVALDAGAAPAYGYDRLQFSRPQTFLTPLDLGGLGFAFPIALGAKLGRPAAPVVAIHGDGGYLMNAHELETAVRHGINVVTIVMNNNCWGSEKAYQRAFYGGRYIGCDIGNPRYDAFARLFGAEGYYAETPGQVGDAVQAALGCGKPAVVEIPIDPDEFPTPAAAVRRRV